MRRWRGWLRASGGAVTRRSESPHIGYYSGNVRDYNGTGKWSTVEVRKRYLRYCDLLNVREVRVLMPVQHKEGDRIWIHPIMDEVIRGIEAGDPACMTIGVEFVEEDDFFVFGAILKSNTARALRRTQLPEGLKARLRQRIVSMLLAGMVPREFREYWKLLRDIGEAEDWSRLDAEIPRDNPYEMRYYDRLRPTAGMPAEG